jgi:C4-dicarboxylate transporter, DctM subunit
MVAILFICFVLFIAIGTPISFAIGFSSIFSVFGGSVTLRMVTERIFSAMDSFTLLAIPFFILAGDLMETAGISMRLINLAKVLVGHFRGGLGMVVIVAEYFFSGISGAVSADTAALGSIMLPAMARENYSKSRAVGILCGACAMGILVPPSMSMVVYGGLTGVSIAALFAAGFLPALVTALVLMVQVHIQARRENLPAAPRASLKEVAIAFYRAIPALIMPLIIFGGILGGIFTPTESAVVAVVYGLIIGVFVFKEISLENLQAMLVKTAKVTGVVLLLVSVSNIFAWIVTAQQIPQKLAASVVSLGAGKFSFLLFAIVLFLILGAIMDGLAALIMVVPIFLPIATQLGIGHLHMGIVIIATVGIGLFTPPVGNALFVACSIGDVSVTDAGRAMWPYLVTVTVCIVFMAYVPWVVTVVPTLLGL